MIKSTKCGNCRGKGGKTVMPPSSFGSEASFFSRSSAKKSAKNP